MPPYAPWRLFKEAAGSVRYLSRSEHKASAAPTAAKQVLAVSAITPDFVWAPASLDNTYLANRTRAMYAPAGTIGASSEWITLSGTPDFAQRNSLYGATAFDGASTESIQWLRSVMVPDDYASGFDFVLIWTNLGAGAGNVVWRIGYTDATDSETFPSLSLTDSLIAAPSQNVLKYSVITPSSAPTLAAGTLMNFSVGRLGSDAADTLANDAGFLGLRLRYTADM